MRNGIDEHKLRYSDAGLIPIDLGTDGYPEDLEVLIEGVDLVGQVDREGQVPAPPADRDRWPPATSTPGRGKRSYQDDPDATSWGGENVYDVYSLSQGMGLNGVPYAQW